MSRKQIIVAAIACFVFFVTIFVILFSPLASGSLFLFVNRKRDRIKALWWETGGLILWYKRLEQGTVEIPKTDHEATHVMIDNVELAMWIGGVSLKSARSRRKRMVA